MRQRPGDGLPHRPTQSLIADFHLLPERRGRRQSVPQPSRRPINLSLQVCHFFAVKIGEGERAVGGGLLQKLDPQ